MLPNTGVLGLLATTVCTPAQTAHRPAATNGSLTASGSDLSNFSAIDIDNATASSAINPTATGKCVGDSTVCASSKVVKSAAEARLPRQHRVHQWDRRDRFGDHRVELPCGRRGLQPVGNLTLNAAVTANLTNLASSGITLCFNSNLFIPSLGAAGVTVPWNSYVSSALPLQYTPRPPSTLAVHRHRDDGQCLDDLHR